MTDPAVAHIEKAIAAHREALRHADRNSKLPDVEPVQFVDREPIRDDTGPLGMWLIYLAIILVTPPCAFWWAQRLGDLLFWIGGKL